MRCLLMHKNIEVATIEYESGVITNVYEILCERHMPIGSFRRGMTLPLVRIYLQAWQRNRAIPEDRLNLQDILNATGNTVYFLGTLSHGMSLTDQYWVKNLTESITWEDVNFYKNGFESSLLTLTGIGNACKTPDYRTNGCLPKSWILQDGIPILVKDAAPGNPYMSANEAVAYEIACKCGIEHAMYFPYTVHGKVYCGTPCFINNDNEEYVPFVQYTNLCHGNKWELAKEISIPESFLWSMTAFDLLIGNADRHDGNFGVIIDPNTMEYIRPAPLFDSGTCLIKSSVFKPFWANPDVAFGNLEKVNFKIPSDDFLRSVVSDIYESFGVGKPDNAIEEILKNAERLRKIPCMLH